MNYALSKSHSNSKHYVAQVCFGLFLVFGTVFHAALSLCAEVDGTEPETGIRVESPIVVVKFRQVFHGVECAYAHVKFDAEVEADAEIDGRDIDVVLRVAVVETEIFQLIPHVRIGVGVFLAEVAARADCKAIVEWRAGNLLVETDFAHISERAVAVDFVVVVGGLKSRIIDTRLDEPPHIAALLLMV